MTQGKKDDRKKIVEDAKRVCCEMVQQRDFGFISKIQLALCVRNLVLEYNKQSEKIASLEAQLNKEEAE